MSNLIPAMDSTEWKGLSPYENKRPVFISSQDSLTIRAKAFTDCGKWVCRMSVIAGQDYSFRVDASIKGIKYLTVCVRAIIRWFSSNDVYLRCDYAANIEKKTEDYYCLSTHMKAPKGGKYAEDAAYARVELLLWNCDCGSVVFSNIVMEETETLIHRKVRVVTTYISPYADDSKSLIDRKRKICRTMEKAGDLNPDIVLFSEGIADRDLGLAMHECAETIPGSFTELMSEYARRYDTYIMINLHEKDGDGFYYNTSVLLDRRGRITGKYRKVHLTLNECDRGMTPGREYNIFETDFGKIGCVICFDQFFPESVRRMVAKGAELILVPTAGDGYIQNASRAFENAVPLCISCVNHAANSYWPQSRIVAPDGTILAGTMEDESAVCATVDLDEPLESFWFSVGGAYTVRKNVSLLESRQDTY